VIGLDTNVLIRYFIEDDVEQHRCARQLVDSNDVFLSNVALVESFWVMKKLYGLSKREIERVFLHIQRLSNVSLEDETVFSRALASYVETGCDFGDAIIAETHGAHGCSSVTFDKAAAKKLGMRLL